jgi:hypothetical protein
MAKPRKKPAARPAEQQADQNDLASPDRQSIRLWFKDGENIFFVALVALHLLPIWFFQYFPSQDGPDYLQNSEIIRSYNDVGFDLVREYYFINTSLTPNWAIHLVLAGLMWIMPALVAEKILLTGYVILLPVSIRYAVAGLDPRSKFLAVLALPFMYNSLFHLGFYAFSYSLALFFFVVGYWLKHKERFNATKAIKFSILTILLYFAHPTSFVTAAVAVLFLLAWTVLFKAITRKREGRADLRAVLTAMRATVIATVCAFIPAFVLLGVFFLQQGAERLPPWPIKMLLVALPYLSLVSFSATDAQLAVVYFCFFMAVIIYASVLRLRRPQLRYADALLVLAVIYLYMYFTSPRALSGGALIEQRLVFYPFFAFTLWLAGESFNRLARLGVQLGAAAIALVMLVSYATKYRELNGYLKEYLSGVHLIEPNKTLLPLCLSHRRLPDGRIVSVVVSPFIHAAGYIAAQKQIVALDNHEADTAVFPAIYRPERNPNHHIGRALGKETISYRSTLESEPPDVDFLTYAKRTGGRVDYVLVWGGDKLSKTDPRSAPIYRQLKEGYELIYESPGRGLMQLYKLRQ